MSYTPREDAAIFDLYPDIHITHDNLEHYRGLSEGRLLINRCQNCGHWIYPHRPMCPECLSWDVKPTEVSGEGSVFLFTLIHQLRDPHSTILEPIPVAAIELVEQKGLRYLARVVNCPIDRITHDMKVRLVWIDVSGQSWPAFEPSSGGGA